MTPPDAGGVRIKTTTDDTNGDVTISNDPDQLRSVFDNLKRANLCLLHQPRRVTNRRLGMSAHGRSVITSASFLPTG